MRKLLPLVILMLAVPLMSKTDPSPKTDPTPKTDPMPKTDPKPNTQKGFNNEETEAAQFICTASLYPTFAKKAKQPHAPEVGKKFCDCTVEGWSKRVTFPRLMLTFFKLGKGILTNKHPDVKKIMEPVMVCVVRAGLVE